MKRRTTRERLLIAQGQLRAVRELASRSAPSLGSVTVAPPEPTGRYIQIIAVQRGYSGVLCALDDYGQVWERKVVLEGPKGEQTVKDSWWQKVGMTQR